MYTTPPRPVSAAAPISSCRWKRGRPVASSSSISNSKFSPRRDSGTSAQPSSTVPASGATVRPGLWDPTQGLRFAPGVLAKTYHTEHRELGTDAGPLCDNHVHDAVGRINAVPSTSTPHSPKVKQSDEKTGQWDPRNDSRDAGSLPLDGAAMSANAEAPEGLSAPASPAKSTDQTTTQELDEDTPEAPEPLSYQIPEDRLRAAMLAAPKTRGSYWSTRLYQGPEGEALKIHYCKSKDVAERVAKRFLDQKVLGFDIEWKPFGIPSSIKQNVSLIQLACEDRIALFHISLFEGTAVEELMPPSLKAVLESPDIYKVGVAIKGDFSRLARYLGIQARGVFELSRLHNLVQYYEADPKQVNNRLVGLAAQVHQHLQLPLYKGEPLDDDPETSSSVRESDWSLPLGFSQIHYAAADAYAGFRLYDALERKRAQLKPTPSAILVCDYDQAPKPKSPRKTKKKTVATKDTSDESATSTVDEVEIEQDDDKESDEYETAPQELMTSQRPKNTNSVLSSQRSDATGSSDISVTRRVGRIKLPTLRGPDPAYPVLPRADTPDSTKSSLLSELEDDDVSETSSTSNFDKTYVYKAVVSAELESDNEFADAELEEALQGLTLDSNGCLEESRAKACRDKNEQERGSSTVSPLATGALQITSVGCKDEKKLLADAGKRSEDVGSSSEVRADLKQSQTTESPQYVQATDWAQDYLRATIPSPTATTPSRLRATIPHLRAYHMWHHQQLAVETIAEHLREPPLSLSTVQSYILQAITMEKLEYDGNSLKEVILAMPVSQRKGRWRWLAERIGAL
ncbi:hypothetical protein LEMA_P064310.1 [Plenodomus lingam JN3]|uniref:3'-5' exonuclease domain-containing protein n=2 Tax=Leptosphaeria maculans TaxID=5022 RepID=E4ZG85_LEPMJ|nr:hypothetical protein LEMA_P064310.1 [Plenodomus lingam JN3]CBX90305.1 hypothetical protein LEMA_P064310.1 [Plenodomus lingam JN3]